MQNDGMVGIFCITLVSCLPISPVSFSRQAAETTAAIAGMNSSQTVYLHYLIEAQGLPFEFSYSESIFGNECPLRSIQAYVIFRCYTGESEISCECDRL